MRFSAFRGVAAASAVFSLSLLCACGGSTALNKPTQVVLSPTILSLNQGAVQGLSAVAEDAQDNTVAADIAFTSSNANLVTVSTGGLVCGGIWDSLSTPVNCNPVAGQGGVGQVTITATATAFNLSTTATVYVHLQVDQVQTLLGANCTSAGQAINIGGLAFNTTAPGCSPSAPCDITSTVGPFAFGSNDALVASSSSGVQSTYSSITGTPTYVSGGTITGSKGQTCDLSNFNGVIGATGTVALTGANTIAQGTQLTITAPGHGASVAPTAATLTNGTATCSGTATVSTVLTNGIFTAEVPGSTTVFASVSGVNGVGVPYLTCPVQSIVVHDAATGNTTFTLAPSATQALTADVYDTNNNYITAPLTWASSTTAVASAATGTTGNNPGIVTAGSGGGTAYVTATCSYPDCNRNVDAQYSQNVATINVTQPVSTTVYAASTNSTTLVPINTSTNTPGTTITLPYVPNSILASPDGSSLYLGSASALMGVSVSSGTVTPIAAGQGTVVAISPDGLYLLISNGPADNLYYFNTTTATVTTAIAGTTTSSAFTPDSKFNELLVAGTNQLEYGPQNAPIGSVTLASDGTALGISGTGSLTYITSASGHQIFVYSTCSVAPAQMLAATAPTLVAALPNATGAVAADPPNIDLITTPAMLNAGCPITTQSSINSYDLGAGSFTPQQILISTDATHAYILSNLPQVLSFDLTTLVPASALLVGGAVPASGGITVDGSRIYVGTSDVTVHQIDTASMTDAGRIEVGLKDANGNPTVPNLVTVVP